MEAMHCALPVVASRVKGHVDLIEDGASGLLYDYDDAEQCAAQIRRLMDAPDLRETLGANARECAARFDLGRVLPEVLEACGFEQVAVAAIRN